MAFSDSLKAKVLERAGYCCCICGYEQGIKIDIEAHHIIPEAKKGLDTEDNAAPLCPSCHSAYGENPQKRKPITARRDYLYKTVEARMKISLTGETKPYPFQKIQCPDCDSELLVGPDGSVGIVKSGESAPDREKKIERVVEDWKDWITLVSEKEEKSIQVVAGEMEIRGASGSGIHKQRNEDIFTKFKKSVSRGKKKYIRSLEDLGCSDDEISKLLQ